MKAHTDNSLFKDDLSKPVVLPLPGFQLQKENKFKKKEKENPPNRQNAELDTADKDAMSELDTLWWATSVLRD